MVLVNLAIKQMTFHFYRTGRVGRRFHARMNFCTRVIVQRGIMRISILIYDILYKRCFSQPFPIPLRFSAQQKFMPFRSSTWHNLAAESSHVHDVRLLTFAFFTPHEDADVSFGNRQWWIDVNIQYKINSPRNNLERFFGSCMCMRFYHFMSRLY